MPKNILEVVGITALFLGIAVQPGIIADVSIKSDDSELVEITVQICEVDKSYNHNVMLKQQQAKELENLINNFKIELDAAENLDETEAIFNNTVASLNKLGLLPEDMSVEEAQRLVTGKEQDPKIVKFLERWYSKNQKSLDDNENILCLISGDYKHGMFLNIPFIIRTFTTIMIILWLTNQLPTRFPFFFSLLEKIGIDWENANFWNGLLEAIIFGWPFHFGGVIAYGSTEYDPWAKHHIDAIPAEGWVNSFGLIGRKEWEGSFFGQYFEFPLFFTLIAYIGTKGFIGIKILRNINWFFIGFALDVKLGPNPP